MPEGEPSGVASNGEDVPRKGKAANLYDILSTTKDTKMHEDARRRTMKVRTIY